MDITTANIHNGDKFKFAEDSRDLHTAARVQHHSYERALRVVQTVAGQSLTIPVACPLFAVEQLRQFTYECVTCGDKVKILFDIVSGSPPHSVRCGDCPGDDDEYDDTDGCEGHVDTDGCEGHVDTDDALTSGAGIGEPVYCDGSCNPKRK